MNGKIHKKVNYLVKNYGTRDPEKLAEYLKIKIYYLPLGNIAGFYRYMAHNRCIYINSEIDDIIYRKVVIAHELGHAVSHSKENCTFMAQHTLLLTTKVERQANIFAAHLLIDDEMLKSYAGYTEEQFCNCTGYPKELVELRIGYQK